MRNSQHKRFPSPQIRDHGLLRRGPRLIATGLDHNLPQSLYHIRTASKGLLPIETRNTRVYTNSSLTGAKKPQVKCHWVRLDMREQLFPLAGSLCCCQAAEFVGGTLYCCQVEVLGCPTNTSVRRSGSYHMKLTSWITSPTHSMPGPPPPPSPLGFVGGLPFGGARSD